MQMVLCLSIKVLAVFSKIGINDALYFIIFGESLLNGVFVYTLFELVVKIRLFVF